MLITRATSFPADIFGQIHHFYSQSTLAPFVELCGRFLHIVCRCECSRLGVRFERQQVGLQPSVTPFQWKRGEKMATVYIFGAATIMSLKDFPIVWSLMLLSTSSWGELTKYSRWALTPVWLAAAIWVSSACTYEWLCCSKMSAVLSL